MQDDLTALNQPNHWLGWLGDDPGQAVRDSLEHILQEQVEDAHLDWLRLVGTPEFLTGGRKIPDEPDKIIVTRVALAVCFELQVSSKGYPTEILSGVFSWVARDIDAERRDQTYMEIAMDLETAASLLQMRIYGDNSPRGPIDYTQH